MSKSITKLIDEQVKRWELDRKSKPEIPEKINVITISRECGSKGMEVAQLLCERTGFDLFHHEIVDAMVETSKSSRQLLETLDEKAMNVVDDVVSNFINEHHLWPDDYSKCLLKILNTIASHGRAIILGRGANCALSSSKNILRVRVVAPLMDRRKNIQVTNNLSSEDARKLTVSTDANRTSFVKRYFNCDSTDSSNYDLILNTGTLSVERAVQVILCAID